MGLALPCQSRWGVAFAHHALTLGSGNALAQLVVLGASPVIAHLYSPEAFGIFAAYTVLLQLLSVAATAQYERALMLPRQDRHAACLLLFLLMFCPSVALGFGLLLILFRDGLAALVGMPHLAVWFWALPVSIAMAGWYQALRFWTMRQEAFADVARNAVTRAAIGTGLACAMGLWPPFPGAQEGGLILSQILGEAMGNLLLVWRIRRRDRGVFSWPGLRRLLAQARHWRSLVLPLVGAQGIAKLYSSLPILAINALFGPAAAGYYAWADRFTIVPSMLVSTAVGDVYRQRATVEYHRHGRFDGLMRRTVGVSTAIAVLPYALGIVIAPALFAWLFGPIWRESGVLAQILLVGGFVSFIVNPVDLDKAAVICQRTPYVLAWHVARLGLKLAVIAAVGLMDLTLVTLVWLIVIVRLGLYGVDLVCSYQLAQGTRSPAMAVQE